LRSAVIGLRAYQPGWKRSLRAGPQTGKTSASQVGYIISGSMMIQDADGACTPVEAGEVFEVGPDRDAWVVGAETCIALDFAAL
jgi:hypothetical protein